jgi:CHAT domain
MARRIGSQQVAFFQYELSQGDAKRKKVALQDLCALYRKGQLLSAEHANQFETAINGILLQVNQDAKVVRWCLNALAQFGRLASSQIYVETALTKYAGDPEIEAAGVAALCRMFRGSVQDIGALKAIDPIVWKLAALQNTDPSKIEVGDISIDIYRADPAVLRLALITVGLNRDIENLFHPKHSNAEFVRHLGQHDDVVVQQYSVWSIIENRRLCFNDLGISLDKIDSVKSNVQSKIYQLVAERDHDDRRRLAITCRGSAIAPNDAREGLAKGVRSHYYDGLEGVTIDWFRQEQHKPIREILAEHFAKFADICGPYEDLAMEINESDASLRERLLLGAEGKPLYSRLKAPGSNDLFAHLEMPYDIVRAIREQSGRTNVRDSRKVLLLTASPLDQSRVRVEAEYRDLEEGLRRISNPRVEIVLLLRTAVRPGDILPSLLNDDFDIFHFSGHATTDGLLFEDADGRGQLVDAEAIAAYLRKMGRTLRCVVLNACYTDAFANVLTPHVQVLIGCDSTIGDDAAIAFSRAFYQALAAGRSYADSFDLAVTDVKVHGFVDDAEKYVMRRR